MRFIKKHLFFITIIFIIVFILGLFYIKYNMLNNSEVVLDDKKSDDLELKEEEVLEVKLIHVDVKGAVKKPGVYEVSSDKLVIDAVNLAGGLSDNADTSFINLAKKVQDEMVVIIYTADEVKKALTDDNNNSIIKVIDKKCVCPSIKNDACINTNSNNKTSTSNKDNSSSNTNNTSNEEILVNINTASLEELESIPGIGESKAKAIISYREEVGSFSSIEDIKNVSGIGDSLYEKIKTYITI